MFNSHIAIFGNTGSGKSNTLAALYQALFSKLKKQPNFKKNSRYFFFDFNREYTKETCLTKDKKVYSLTTRDDSKDKIPMTFDELMDIETLSILLEATEKTQKPFLKRALRYYRQVKDSRGEDGNSEYPNYFKNIIMRNIKNTLIMTNKDTAFKILDYLDEILSYLVDEDIKEKLRDDICFHDTNKYFYLSSSGQEYENKFLDHPDKIEKTNLYQAANTIDELKLLDLSELNQFFIFILIQLVNDLFR